MAVPLSVSQIEARKEKKIVEAKRGDTQINEQTLDDTKIASLSEKRPLHFDNDELFKMDFIDTNKVLLPKKTFGNLFAQY